MASEGTSKVNENRSKGKGRTKRTWIASEDDALVDSLGELVVSGNWKCDTGFKIGYLNALEKLMEEKLPGCGLMAVPHIESRVKTLKKQALAINEMLISGSGFSWDDVKKKVVCEKSIFNGWLLAHKDATGLYDKAFPHLDDLIEASTIILGCPTKTKVFLGMPVDVREYYVKQKILGLPSQ